MRPLTLTQQRLYGESAATFKAHQSLHLPSMLRQHGILPTCWTAERKHRNPKRWVNPVHNHHAQFDKYALRDVTASHYEAVQANEVVTWVGLVPPLKAVPGNLAASVTAAFGLQPNIMASRAARCNDFEVVYVGDVVEGYNAQKEGFLGKVLLHLSIPEPLGGGLTLLTLIEVWQCVENTAYHTKWDAQNPAMEFVATTDIMAACIFARTGSKVTVLRSGRSRVPS